MAPPSPRPAVASARTVARAEADLAERDPVVAGLIDAWGPYPVRPNRGSHFAALCRSILFQQLAGAAARAIHARFAALFPDGVPTPDTVLALPEGALRAVGLSGAKAAAIADLAAKVADGSVDLDTTHRLADDELVARLSTVRGIGTWTAEMFALFQLGRLDVWPVGDLGVRRGYGQAWGLAAMPTPKELAAQGERFRPWRSVVAWYCWRAAETVTP